MTANLQPCPDCGHDVSKNAPSCPRCGALVASKQKAVAGSTIGCSYVLAFLIPFAGFFAGIYLVAKKEAGHGVAVIALSIIAGFIVLATLVSR